MSVKTVVLSGMHSGPNPAPGLGLARSLRLARPDLRIVGVDHSPASSGLHADVLDDVLRLPAWDEIDENVWVEQMSSLVADEETVLLPTMDLEVRLLAATIGAHERILAPSKSALDAVRKPATAVADLLGLRTARYEKDTTRASVERFTRQAAYGVWVKGEHYEAFRAHDAEQAVRLGAFIEEAWGGRWHLEEHTPGQECGLAFAARDGELLDAVFTTKALVTPEGKTWSGDIAEVDDELWARLCNLVADFGWTGGGEVELIRSWTGELTVMELNPRFPAWIHGATLCGANLPATLIGEPSRRGARTLGTGFTRVVHEIPVRPELGLPAFPWGPSDMTAPASKHPSGMRALGRRRLLAGEIGVRSSFEAAAAAVTAHDEQRPATHHVLARAHGFEEDLPEPETSAPTPRREVSTYRLTMRVAALREAVSDLPNMLLAYSVKTCPHPALVAHAASLGLVGEAITLDEMDAGIAAGFDPDTTILNGPAKWWPLRDSVRCWAFFADSFAELEQLRRRLDEGFDLSAGVVGIRIAPRSVPSRFGIALERSPDVARAAALVEDLCDRLGARWGVHFHHAESVLGPNRWQREATGSLALADRVADRLGRAPSVVDFGGGWHVDDLGLIRDALGHVMAYGPAALRDPATTLVLEPGKLLTEPAASIVTRVLLTSRRGKAIEVVVDAAIGDIPEARYRGHPVARWDGARWTPLREGKDRILGRSCMEVDILATNVDLGDVVEGDTLAFGLCGAYDLSMAYPFGRGEAAGGLR
jgi:diaminopimelate decarboxylase